MGIAIVGGHHGVTFWSTSVSSSAGSLTEPSRCYSYLRYLRRCEVIPQAVVPLNANALIGSFIHLDEHFVHTICCVQTYITSSTISLKLKLSTTNFRIGQQKWHGDHGDAKVLSLGVASTFWQIRKVVTRGTEVRFDGADADAERRAYHILCWSWQPQFRPCCPSSHTWLWLPTFEVRR